MVDGLLNKWGYAKLRIEQNEKGADFSSNMHVPAVVIVPKM
jgi:hypothetical protein